MNYKKKNTSFTLIELLVVIVIIGILAGVIMISTSSSIEKANIAKLKVFEESVNNNLAANMVSRWKLDEIVNTNQTPDAWGNNTGTLYGTNGLPTVKTEGCVADNCMEFDGEDDYIDCGNNASLNITDKITISTWINVTAFSDSYMRIYASKGSNIHPFTVGINSAKLAFADVNNVNSIITTNLLNINTWTYICVVSIGLQDTAQLFINGVLQTSQIGGGFTFSDINNIGSYNGSSHFFNGLIDDVRIYNAALSSSQIKQNYVAGLNSMLANGNISKTEYNERIQSLGSNF